MGEAGGLARLDPEAKEFRPSNVTHLMMSSAQSQSQPQPQIYFPPYFSSTDVQVFPFCAPVQFSTLPAYFSPSASSPPSLLPPPPPPIPFPVAPFPLSAVPTRALLLSSVPANVSESSLRRELEVFGDVRAVRMEMKYDYDDDKIVSVYFYDLRNAQEAMAEVRKQYCYFEADLNSNSNSPWLTTSVAAARGLVAGRAVWAHFMIPAISAVPDGQNQGTLVILNLDSAVTISRLKQIFESFGMKHIQMN